MGNFQKKKKTSSNFCAAARRTTKRQDIVELGATDLKRAFGSGKPWESKFMYCFLEQNCISWYKMQICSFQNCMANRMRNFQSPGFPYNSAQKKDRQDLKMGCIGASRRPLQSVLKVGV